MPDPWEDAKSHGVAHVAPSLLQQLTELAPVPLGACEGPEHVIVYANAKLRALAPHGIIGVPFRDAFPHWVDGPAHEALDRVFGTGVPEDGKSLQTFVVEPVDRAGTLRPLFDGWGTVSGVAFAAPARVPGADMPTAPGTPSPEALSDWEVGLARRERELARREQALSAREHRLDANPRAPLRDVARADEILSLVSHELRTPVHALLGYAGLLQRALGPRLDGSAARHLLRLMGTAEVLSRRVGELLDLGLIKSGAFTVELQPVSFEKLLDEALATLRARALEKGLAVVTRLAPELPILLADRRRLVGTLHHLLDNAVKFTPAGGTILVKAAVEAEWLACEIVDSGVGIAPDRLPRLLEPFALLEPELNRRAAGFELGLALGKATVEAHGGKLELASVPGNGTTVRLQLPLCAS